MKLLTSIGLLSSTLSLGCFLERPESYNPYRKVEASPQEGGPLEVKLSVQPRVMLSPKEGFLVAKIEGGPFPACLGVLVEFEPGCRSWHEYECGEFQRVYTIYHHYHHFGTLHPAFALVDLSTGKIVAQDWTELQIGPPEGD